MPRFNAIAAPGLENIVAEELRGFGLAGEVLPGGVVFEAGLADAVSLVRESRTPARILHEVVEGRVHTLEELVGLVRKGNWKGLLHPLAKLEVTATCARSRLRFREVVQRKVAWAVTEVLKGPRVVDREKRPGITQSLKVRIVDDICTLSLDMAGELLHFRGWRQEQGPAAMRENLATSCLLAMGWTGETPLVDPFCGSGTIPIEAALFALGRSPFSSRRSFACDEWPLLNSAKKPQGAKGRPGPGAASGAGARSARGAAHVARNAAQISTPPVPIFGSDRDARVLAAASANAKRAGVDITFRRLDVSELVAPAELGLVFTNPPWGERLSPDARTVARTWDDFGGVLRAHFGGWRAGFVCPDPGLARRAHPRARRVLKFPNGGIDVGLWAIDEL